MSTSPATAMARRPITARPSSCQHSSGPSTTGGAPTRGEIRGESVMVLGYAWWRLGARVESPGVPASAPAEGVQTGVVDAEMVGDLVDDGHGYLVDHVVARVAGTQRGSAEDGDPIGQGTGRPPLAALGQRG